MESDVACELFSNSINNKVKFSTYIGDDDSTTLANLTKTVPYKIIKYSDQFHTKQRLSSRLYNLSNRKQLPGATPLSSKVINYLSRCFNYCISQNKNNPEGLKQGIKCIVPHAFGDHQNCNKTCCRASACLAYKYGDLPYGKDLHGEALKKALTDIFDEYSTDVAVTKIAPAENSQRNESLNNTIASKNIKTRYYGESESSDFRIACGVAQKNVEHTYITDTLKSINIEPGVHCANLCDSQDKKAANDKIRKSKLPFKRRRRQLTSKSDTKNVLKETEGVTYASNIGLNLDANFPQKHGYSENLPKPFPASLISARVIIRVNTVLNLNINQPQTSIQLNVSNVRESTMTIM